MGCTFEPPDERETSPGHERASQALTGPAAAGLPLGVYRLTITRYPYGGECFGNHVAPGWVLTAAHCFAGMGAPNDGQPDVSAEVTFNLARPGESSVNTTVAPVYFHPAAVKTKALLEWTQGFLVSDLDCAHDLALVRVAGLEGRPVVPLYLPQCAAGNTTSACATGLPGLPVSFGGSSLVVGLGTGSTVNQGFVKGQIFKGNACINISTNADLLLLDPSTGAMPDRGDSGTGLLAAAPGPSAKPVTSLCDVAALPEPGQQALIGVLTAGIEDEFGNTVKAGFVPTFVPTHAEWLALRLTADTDGDAVCDADDNCPDVPNADQRNSNLDAERAWGSAKAKNEEYGDACDPAPTPVPRLAGPSKPSEGLPFQRIVRDRIRIEPVLGVGAVSGDTVRPLFCMCRDEGGKPKQSFKECQAPPFHCVVDGGLIFSDEAASDTNLDPTHTCTSFTVTGTRRSWI